MAEAINYKINEGKMDELTSFKVEPKELLQI